jgi:hypothetical protein
MPSADSIQSFQHIIEEGLGDAHNLSGTCTFELSDDADASFTLHLRPGRVSFKPPHRKPSTTITLSRRAMEQIIAAKGRFDFREPAFVRQVQHSGDDGLYIDVVHSLIRPSAEDEAIFRGAEAKSAASEKVAKLSAFERVKSPSEAELLERISEGIPFVVTGALDGWEARGRSVDELVGLYGEVPIKSAMAPEGETMASFVARARGKRGPGLYTLGTALPEELLPKFAPAYFDPKRLAPPQLWMGAGMNEQRPVTPLHRDLWCGLLGHVLGKKRLTLFAPHHAEHVYPRPTYVSYQLCWATPNEPDYERYPKLKRAKGIDVVLEPGELLVNPAGWFHCVYSLTELTMSVSYFLLS